MFNDIHGGSVFVGLVWGVGLTVAGFTVWAILERGKERLREQRDKYNKTLKKDLE